MNVALLNDSPRFAGTERHMLDLAIALRDEGVGVTLVAAENSALATRAASANLPLLTFRRQSLFSAVPTLRKLLRTKAVDLLHAHDGVSAMQCALATRLAGRGACVKTQHFIEPARLARRGLKRWLSDAAHAWVNGRVSGCIAISRVVRDAMAARGERPRGDMVVIPNGVAVTPPADLPPRSRVRRELGVTDDQTMLLCLARLEQEKNVGALVDAMRTVHAQLPQVRCFVGGEGSLRATLLQQIRSSDLTGVVELLGFRDDAFALLNAADAFVLPSFAEPFGLVLLEAMALSKPVVAVDIGGPSEIVLNGRTGLLSPSPDARPIADALLQLLADPELRGRIGDAARQRYHEYFTPCRMARATANFYRQIQGQAADSSDRVTTHTRAHESPVSAPERA